MDSGYKNISCFDEADAKNLLESFFSPCVPPTVNKELTINLLRSFYKVFSEGLITGGTVIDLSFGPIIVPLLPMKDFVQEITVLVINDASQKELEKWMNQEPDAFDWSYTTELYRKIRDKRSFKDGLDEEEKLRRKIKKILKWDGDLSSVPKAAIATSTWGLESLSKDTEDYIKYLRKLSRLLKVGGHLIMYASINASYLKVGGNKFRVLPGDEDFYKKAIREEGFQIKNWEKVAREMIGDSIDHEAMAFIVAEKVREP